MTTESQPASGAGDQHAHAQTHSQAPREAPKQEHAKPAAARLSGLTDEDLAALLARISAIENTITMLDTAPVVIPDIKPEPTLLELSQSFAKDDEATAAMTNDEVLALLAGLPEGDQPPVDETMLDFSVRGPYVVAVFSNGHKYCALHNLEGVRQMSRVDAMSGEVS